VARRARQDGCDGLSVLPGRRFRSTHRRAATVPAGSGLPATWSTFCSRDAPERRSGGPPARDCPASSVRPGRGVPDHRRVALAARHRAVAAVRERLASPPCPALASTTSRIPGSPSRHPRAGRWL